MPELPEVETIKRSLLSEVVGDTITKCRIYFEKMLQNITGEQFLQEVSDTMITDVRRRGKYLLVYLSNANSKENMNDSENSSDSVMIIHLRMTGRFTIVSNPGNYPKENELYNSNNEDGFKHLRAVFFLNSGKVLEFHDQRKFGTIALLNTGEEHDWKGLSKLGPEPLSCDFSQEDLSAKLARTKKPVKACLLDQQLIAGVGNIYADEALYRAKIHPAKPGDKLTEREKSKLFKSMCEVLQLGIKYRGTTFSDYRDFYGNQGEFQNFLKVYNQNGLVCNYCGETIEKSKVANRGTFFCPCCQSDEGEFEEN